MADHEHYSTLSQHHGSGSGPHQPNRMSSRGANPMVLSSIISSLETDTITPLPDNDLYSDAHSHPRSHSRAYSERSVASSASIHRAAASPSPGFGVEYGVGLALDDDEGLSHAALPPTVPTSRPPSGLSNYTAVPSPRSPAFARSSSRSRVSIGRSGGSRRSSFSTTSAASTRNKLSSESWVRQSEEALDSESARRKPLRKAGHLRRLSSQDGLRPPMLQSPTKSRAESFTTSRAEQILAASSSQTSLSKTRLFLADVAVNGDRSPTARHYPSPPASPLVVEPKMERDESDAVSTEDLSPAALTPPLLQKTPSPISDSIPTRTSSLRLSSSSPAGGKRKSKKPKRNTLASGRSGTSSHKSPKPILDSTWDDLDEDDETVKRIRQLREQRRSRLQESFFPPVEDTVESSSEQVSPVGDLTTHPRDEISASPSRSVTELTKTHSNLRSSKDKESPLQEFHGSQLGVKATSNVPEVLRMPKYSLDVKRPASAHNRPTTAKSDYSTIQPHSLDYSYAEAVDMLHGIVRNKPWNKDVPNSRNITEPSPLWLKGLDLPSTPSKAGLETPKLKSTKPKKSPRNKWTGNYPDMPLDFSNKRNQRKSTGDTRNAQVAEEPEDQLVRDSIEDAVVDFLRAPRLSRTIKSPTTGRTIAFSEVGDPKGAAVFICVGMGLTRYVTAFYDELAATLRLRLITVDRPGVGGSDPYPSSNKSGPLGWPEDILAICQYLGIAKFSLLAHSAGAIYALATALILPHLIKGKVHLLAPWVPPSQLEAISHPTASAPPANPLPRSQRFLRVLPTPFLKAANASFMTATSTSLKPASKRKGDSNNTRIPPHRGGGAVQSPSVPPRRSSSHGRPEYNRRESMMLMDQDMPSTTPLEPFPAVLRGIEEDNKRNSLVLSATAVPTDPSFTYASSGLNAAEHAETQRQSEYTSRLTQSTWDLATRDSNPATDLVVCLERNRDVGFRYTDVSREVIITHGSEDKRVPIANVKWLAEQMNRRALSVQLGNDGRESREAWADPSSKGGCELRVLQGEGHGLMASPAIMGDILTEIAGYWIGSDKGRM